LKLSTYDWQAIKNSVLKTKRVIFVNEDTEVTNFGEHLAYRVSQELFYDLYARPKVHAGKNVPGIGLHPNLEEASVPHKHDIEEAIREVLNDIP
jgi:2-oxoisovalerate dehydrogenase E1 component beta subunit